MSLASHLQLLCDYITDQALTDMDDKHCEVRGGYVEQWFKHNPQDIERVQKSPGSLTSVTEKLHKEMVVFKVPRHHVSVYKI